MSFKRRMGVLVVAVAAVAGVGAYYEHRLPADSMAPPAKTQVPPHTAMAHYQAALHATRAAAATSPRRPDFTINTLNGEPVSPSRWDGRIVLYNFWAAWCPPCRREIPVFNEVRDFYHDDGFEVVGIAIDERDAVTEFLAGLGDISYPQLIGVDTGMQAMAEYGNKSGGLPYSVLVDQQGRIRYVKQGELRKGDLIQQIGILLAEAQETSPTPPQEQ